MRRRIQGRNKKQFQVESLEGRLAPSSVLGVDPPLSAVLGVHGDSGEHVNPEHETTGNALQGLAHNPNI